MIAAALVSVLALVAARPLTLAEATELAVGSSPVIDRAHIAEERARLVVLRANLERVHASIDLSLSGLYAKDLLALDTGGLLGLVNVEGGVSAPLFSGFRVEADIARAEHLQQAAALDVEVDRQQVALAVARAYWGVRRLALLEQARVASDERLAESERLVQARVAAGLAAGLDVNRASGRRAQLDVERATLASDTREARVQLQMALGIDDEVDLVDAPPAADLALDGVDALVQRAIDHRPELLAASRRRQAIDEERRAAESAYWPQVGSSLLVQGGNNPSVPGVGNRAVGSFGLGLTAGVGMSMNLFDTWSTTHAVEDAAHRRREADADMRQQLLDVERAVRVAHARVASLQEQRAALVRARAIVEDNTGMLERAYQRGEVLLTELLDAQVELADAERRIVDVDAQMALARIELERAAGGKP